jgi:uncharacterized protein (TIGR02246 family)
MATIEVSGKAEHRGAALQEARFVVDEIAADRKYEHRLMNYNNDATTTFADIQEVLRITENLITLRLKANGSKPLAQDATPTSERAAIEQIVENWNRAWQTKDARLAAQDYSDDADWTNAFGMKKKGRAEIEKFLGEVFSLPFVMAGQSKGIEQSVRFINTDVALVTTRVERVGQRTPSGEEMGTRQTSHLRVLVKSGANWKIVSHLISDARDPERREH